MEEMIKDFSEDIFLKEKVDFGILNAMDDWVRVVDRDERTIFINKKDGKWICHWFKILCWIVKFGRRNYRDPARIFFFFYI